MIILCILFIIKTLLILVDLLFRQFMGNTEKETKPKKKNIYIYILRLYSNDNNANTTPLRIQIECIFTDSFV